jgi:hypothetical protein
MLYKEHIESVIESLRRYANDQNTDLILLRNHLEQIICDVVVEIDKKVELGKEYQRKYVDDKKETPWVVHCSWCDKTIVKGEERIVKDHGQFCSSTCWWNFDDCHNGEDF